MSIAAVRKRILFKTLTLMHRALHQSSPEYLPTRVQFYSPPRNLQSSSGHFAKLPRIRDPFPSWACKLGIASRLSYS